MSISIREEKCVLTSEALGVLLEKLVGGVRPASQNPYPNYDHNLAFFVPYLWSGQKFDTYI